ncbi:MAG TPA: hypothetical protein VHI93_04300, partial [Candidatus Thermoplasmatota archaeon]|nr:hypothetical protein [Candidatus Thermoplasmatota archaeon]
GESWSCNPVAIPGVTDRMWILGTGEKEAYLQTNHGLYQNQWSRTTNGGFTYLPYAATTMVAGNRNGNMVDDPAHGAVWQLQWAGQDTVQLVRVDGAVGLVSVSDTRLAPPLGFPWLAIQDGTLWTTAEPQANDGSRSVTVASSSDQGHTWRTMPLPITPKTATLSSVAVGTGGRVAVAYYGSDTPGAPETLTGDWDFYVMETENGFDDKPVWQERRLAGNLHHGALCVGLPVGEADDPGCRFAGDLLGIALDLEGNVHLGYAEERDGEHLLQYVRQDPIPNSGSAP